MGLSRQNMSVAIDIMDLCLRISDSKSLGNVIDRFSNLLPFRSAVICTARRDAAGGRIWLDEVVNHSYDPEWIREYKNENYILIDPIIAYGRQNVGPFAWGKATAAISEPTVHVEKFLEAAGDFGLVGGVSGVQRLHAGNGYISVVSFATNEKCLDVTNLNMLQTLLPHVHEAMSRLRGKTNPDAAAPPLTAREIEVLNWGRDGKTAWEIGRILSISGRTVKFHLSNTYAKLDVVNRSQAVAKAMSFSLI